MDKLQALAENIKTHRKANKLSQTDLADKLGTHLTHISRIENGKYSPSVEDLIKLADVFSITLDELVNGSGQQVEEIVQGTPLYQKIKMIEELEEEDRHTILNVINSMLTKKRMKDLIEGKVNLETY